MKNFTVITEGHYVSGQIIPYKDIRVYYRDYVEYKNLPEVVKSKETKKEYNRYWRRKR